MDNCITRLPEPEYLHGYVETVCEYQAEQVCEQPPRDVTKSACNDEITYGD